MSEDDSGRLLDFFKALADKARLKIVGVLAQRDATTEDLAEILNLTPGTVSHHLGRLSKTGLVTARARGYYSIYQLEISALENMAKTLLGHKLVQSLPEEELEAFDKKVLRDFTTKAGKFKTIPAQRKKRAVLLHHLKNSFKPGVRYTDQSVDRRNLRSCKCRKIGAAHSKRRTTRRGSSKGGTDRRQGSEGLDVCQITRRIKESRMPRSHATPDDWADWDVAVDKSLR